jgi:hypothetical protein
MKAIIVLECDPESSEALDDLVTELRHMSGSPIRVAIGDVAERILSTFVVEGKEEEWARRQKRS